MTLQIFKKLISYYKGYLTVEVTLKGDSIAIDNMPERTQKIMNDLIAMGFHVHRVSASRNPKVIVAKIQKMDQVMIDMLIEDGFSW